MNHPVIDALPAPTQKALAGPAPMRAMVARGLAPLPPVALVSALYALSYDSDDKLSSAAKASLEKLPPAVLEGALSNAELPAAVLDHLASRFPERAELIQRIVGHPNTDGSTVQHIASHADESLCELIAVNEQRLLAMPAIIETLYMNTALRMSTADRIVELAARNGIELSIPGFHTIAASLRDQLIPEPGEATPADDMFRTALVEGEEHPADDDDEDVVDRDEEGEETLKQRYATVEKSVNDMTISEKVRIATLGSSSQRMILVRSANRAIAMAAIASPRAQESEAVKISASRQVGEDILRFVANKREWARLYQVKSNLCSNPKTPIATSLRLLTHLRETELKGLSRSKNVPQALKTAVTQLLSKRAPK